MLKPSPRQEARDAAIRECFVAGKYAADTHSVNDYYPIASFILDAILKLEKKPSSTSQTARKAGVMFNLFKKQERTVIDWKAAVFIDYDDEGNLTTTTVNNCALSESPAAKNAEAVIGLCLDVFNRAVKELADSAKKKGGNQ